MNSATDVRPGRKPRPLRVPWFMPLFNALARPLIRTGLPMGPSGLLTSARSQDRPAQDQSRRNHRLQGPALGVGAVGRGRLGEEPACLGSGERDHSPEGAGDRGARAGRGTAQSVLSRRDGGAGTTRTWPWLPVLPRDGRRGSAPPGRDRSRAPRLRSRRPPLASRLAGKAVYRDFAQCASAPLRGSEPLRGRFYQGPPCRL